MSTEAWIFVVGFRVFDVGLLIVWLVWFFRLRDDGSDPPDDEGGGGGGSEPDPRPAPGGGGTGLRTGRVTTGRRRVREGYRAPPVRLPRRGVPRVPAPLPARVRSPGAPAKIPRRA
ncbi:MAG: hypothetical protein WKF29_04935 [Thermoleophilaceae bacterium]